ncbi:MAG: AAA family ATPase [Proteobacteria bacterium]|nr:AAA family ATPase [Pseudomonadota bacterium]
MRKDLMNFCPSTFSWAETMLGKSALIDLLSIAIERPNPLPPEYVKADGEFKMFSGRELDEDAIRSVFLEEETGGYIRGNHFAFGKTLIGEKIIRHLPLGGQAMLQHYPDGLKRLGSHADVLANQLCAQKPEILRGLALRKISAERDVVAETNTNSLSLQPNGDGATNLVQRFLTKANLNSDLVSVDLLSDLNEIYLSDNVFGQILCQEISSGEWEIFLKERHKGLIPVSQSGSGLKTIILVLIHMHLLPIVDQKALDQTVFAFEELENNLHPSLLRRLLQYLARKQEELGCTFVLTTHSGVMIDWFSRRDDAQIIHVTHDGKNAVCRNSASYMDNKRILDDLDIRASDILQSNGIIWVEGPSDRIYLKRWIEIWSDGQLLEGTHYQCMPYGGRLLNHFEGLPPDEVKKGIAILGINRNAAVVIDSDKKRVGKSGRIFSKINDTKCRIRDEVKRVGGFVWITEGKEIENYISIETLRQFLGKPKLEPIDKLTPIFDTAGLTKFRKPKADLAVELGKEKSWANT